MCRAQFPAGANFCPHDGQQLTDLGGPGTDDDPFIGALLDDRYRIESRLGHGGMGVVYAARHEVIDKPVAIKVLRDEYCRDPGMVERFMREARAVSRIGHPHIVDVTDFGRLEDGHIYFVMEFLAGTTLSRELRNHGNLAPWRVCELTSQMCLGLQGAHEKGIVHRDLKPENVFIINPSNRRPERVGLVAERRNFVKLLDFGIAKISWGQGARLTRAGSIFGTPQYMSPEQAAGEDGDHRGDIYALGCMVYEMVTGEVPFLGETFMATLTMHMFEDPVTPTKLRPDLEIPAALEAVVLRSMAKDPGARFQSMAEMACALSECSVGGPASAPEPTPKPVPPAEPAPEPAPVPVPPAEPAPEPMATAPAEPVEVGRIVPPTDDVRSLRRTERNPLPLVATLVALLILGAVGLVLYRRGPRSAEKAVADAGPVDVGVSSAPAEAGPRALVDAGRRTVRVISVPAGAKVLVDGLVIGRTPHEVPLPDRPMVIELRRRGYATARRSLSARDAQRPLTVRLRRQRTPPRPRLDDLRNPYDGRPAGRRR